MIEITLNNKEYLLVEVPDDAYDFNLAAGNIMFLYHNLDIHPNGFELIKYDNNNLLLIGEISKILKYEAACKKLVKSKRIKESWYSDMTTVYLNYLPKEDLVGIYCQEATDSFQSWVESIDLDMTKSWILIQRL